MVPQSRTKVALTVHPSFCSSVQTPIGRLGGGTHTDRCMLNYRAPWMPGSILPRPWQGAELFALPWNCDPVSFKGVVLKSCWFLMLFWGFICYTKANSDKQKRTAIHTDILTLQRVQGTPFDHEKKTSSVPRLDRLPVSNRDLWISSVKENLVLSVTSCSVCSSPASLRSRI